ncbi:MAG: protein-disulfide reductase DsbD N-terminal domain-containing protein [Gemmataceae bacterium]|nr:protein-disulfide reductase DsbD N-terminal domain-containing protein [Gemmataceae bacterium]
MTHSIRRGLVHLLPAALLLGAVALTAGPAVEAGGKKSHTKVTATSTKPDSEGRQTVTVTLEIDEGWYAYANPVGNEDLEQAQTTLKFTSKTKLEEVKIEYPKGKLKVDGKERYYTYADKVTIKAHVRRARGDTGPLDLSVKYMNCNVKGLCLPPETVKLKVE